MRALARRLVLVACAGCAGYEANVAPVRNALARGDDRGALAAVNRRLNVKTADDLPEHFGADTPLLLLERAMLLQALGRYDASERDLQEADKHLELLDLTRDTAGSIGKYLYSDDAAVYKAPAYEKLLLSTINMVNYLAQGDLEGARVEARRLTVTREYLKSVAGDAGARFGLGSYLAGFAFEKSGRPDEAMHYYDDALEAQPYPSLGGPVARLARQSTWRGPHEKDLLAGDPSQAPSDGDGDGEVLVLLQSGLAPRKVPERFPVGVFFAWAYDVSNPRYAMTPAERANADIVVAKSLLKWVNFPVLEPTARRVWPQAAYVDAAAADPEAALDVSTRVRDAYEATKGPLVVAAVTRLVARALAAEVTQRSVKAASNSGALGLLAGLALEGALVAKDTPDTRSWSTLPSEIALVRMRVPAGSHTLTVDFATPWGPRRRQARVDVAPGGWAFVNFSELR